METATIHQLSTDQLEALLNKRKKEDKEKREAEKKAYETEKDGFIEKLFDEAKELSCAISRFKQKCHAFMDIQKQKLDAYGGIKASSKGGFSIIDTQNLTQITRRRDTDPVWDERASKAVELIKDFLGDTVKKRDKDLHEILMGFLERNQNGDLEYAKVMDLIKHENSFDDLRWLQGLKLIKESYSQCFKAFGYEFKQRNLTGKWETLSLNFSKH
ncbi:DUF3164 family protein [Pedobacter sp. ASV28]|jgi:Protein of unknown function (DUF3164)|uniref:DUF3164 family protein n=1 Tax=Pedobacter sp. ASV28 TaxID=2795123 RepID=UPI0018EADBA0|nr:DUF3164 family protein [Pedobacter sp. ASV28]